MSSLHSEYLQDIREAFEAHRKALAYHGKLQFEDEPNELVTRELWEVALRTPKLSLALTVWGDSIATLIVREGSRKRAGKVLLRLEEFPLLATPEAIYLAFIESASSLVLLLRPPDPSPDQELLDRLRAQWLALSKQELH
jgi:hypothetical protein